jgi:hypothetical protein
VDISGHYWLTLVAVTASVVLYASIAWRAFFFRPPVTLVFVSVFALVAVIATTAPTVGMVVAMVGTLALIGWHTYYVCVDWKSRSLRWVVAGLLGSLLATGMLLLSR